MQDQMNPKDGQADPAQQLPEQISQARTGPAAAPSDGGSAAPAKRPPLWTAAASYVVGYLYVASFLFGFALDAGSFSRGLHSGAKLLFAAVFFGWGSLTLRMRGGRQENCEEVPSAGSPGREAERAKSKTPRESWFWMICGMVIAAALAFGRCHATELPAYLALHGIAAYWVLCRAGLLTEEGSGPFFPWDVFNALVIAPFGGFLLRARTLCGALWDACRTVRQRRRKKLDTKNMKISALLVLLSLPLLFAAGELLSRADASFASFWQFFCNLLRFQWPSLPRWFGEFGWRFLWSLPVGAYLCGLVGGSLQKKRPVLQGGGLRAQAEGLRVAPMGGLTVIFVLFCGLYAVFFVIQAGHLFGAFFGNVPGKITAAEYAREGFFQLCQVMAINFGLLAAAAKLSRIPLRENGALKFFTLLLMAESLLLAVTAGSKLWLYIDRFGFTARRLLSFWAVLVLAAGCILAIASTLKPCRAVQKWIWFAVAAFTLLCLY